MNIDTEKLNQIDLTELSRYILEEEFRSYFLADCGKEHYKLISYLSTQFNDSLLLDIGTYKGCSSLALSYNKSNEIISFDIIHNLKRLSGHPENISYIVDDVLKDSYSWMIMKSPFIILDTYHDGTFEEQFYNKLKDLCYEGILLVDDIYLNKEMKYFWDSIEHKKIDISQFGHHSGTGLVIFKQ